MLANGVSAPPKAESRRMGLRLGVAALLVVLLGGLVQSGLLWELLPDSLLLSLLSGLRSAVAAQAALLGKLQGYLSSEERSSSSSHSSLAKPWQAHRPVLSLHSGGARRREPPQFLVDPTEAGWPLEQEEPPEHLLPPPMRKEDGGRPARELETEALATLAAAVELREAGRLRKAARLFEHARALAPDHPDVLNELGLFLEQRSGDLVGAERMYSRALASQPSHSSALANRERTLPLVEEIDQKMLAAIDAMREAFLAVPRSSTRLRRAMKEAYFLHVYHTVAIEGNTMNLMQTRSILETHLAVGGKSVVEHNEIMGMDQALRFLNRSLVHRIGDISIHDIQEIHHRVLGFVDPFQAGKFRDHQVYVGDFVPVPAEDIRSDMETFIEWLNSDETLSIHPVEMAAIAHYKFVYIHPFVDGNGRTARLLMNLILMQAGYPPVIIRVEDRLTYYETLKAANEGDLRPFIRFIAAATERTLASYIAATTASSSGRTPRANIGERETPSGGELAKEEPWPHYQDDLFKL